MPGWDYSPSTGFALDNGGGSDRYAFVPTDSTGVVKSLPTSSAVIARLVDTADEVGILVYASGDRDNGWRVGVDGTNVFIQKMTLGVLAAASDTAAHAVSGATPFKIDVRPSAVNGTTIEVRINDVDTPVVSYDITSSDSFAGYSGYGFDSDVDGARVASLEVAQLVPTYAARADIPWFVCGGEFWCSLDGRSLTRVEQRALNGAAVQVDGDDLDQKVYLVDGANARVFDPAAMTVTKWVPSPGDLPGQTADGTTDANICTQYNGRIMLNEEQNAFASAINNAQDWNTSAASTGAAFDLATGQAGKIGQPIHAMLRLGKTQLLIGCSRSLWIMRGDFALGQVEIDPILDGVGATGKDAMLRVSDDLALVHTTQGLYVVQSSGAATPLSRLVLTDTINVDTTEGAYAITVCRDIKRSGTLVFLTLKAGGDSTHIWYDERTGKFLPPQILGQSTGGGAGYFPEQYPERVGPLCAMEFDGRVLMGGRDGYVYTFDDEAEDDDGDEIESYMPMLVLHEGDLCAGVRLTDIETMLADWSGSVTISVYAGQTTQEAYEGTLGAGRSLRRRLTSSPKRNSHTIDVSGAFLVLEVRGTGPAWASEIMQASTAIVPVSRASYLPIPAPPLPCGVAAPTTSGPGNGEGPGPGDPVGGGPTKCIACEAWMAANSNGTVDGEDAYLLIGPTTFEDLQSRLDDAKATILKAGICDVTGDPFLYVTHAAADFIDVGAGITQPVLTSTLEDLDSGTVTGSEDSTWRAWFRCSDNALAES